MAYPLTILPDPMVALRQYLMSCTPLTSLTSATKIVTELPVNPDYSTPYIVLTSVGGGGIWPAIDEPALQVDSVGGDKATCSKVARTVRACVWAIANDRVPEGLLCSGSEETSPAWLPDTISNPPVSRFTARYRFLLKR